ncbi:ornithine cyclodeaminase family protein [Amycolatopsis jejuensis]|uniref:ornithine cyclodeaminase family protein n=1 Tax=Amycolatopsis jejuensis TaxID=330084 RepID=UPI00052581A2|nr:ornithine cyclodeaminase family protein [Amycolatopsis jejuensis]
MEIVRLDAGAVRENVSMARAIAAVRQAFLDYGRGEFEMPLRTALADGQFLVMTAHHRPSRSAMVKTLSLNFGSRTPSIVGTVTWTDLDRTGQIAADASAVTALRTGAVSGVATDLLAPPRADTCTVVGAGAQGADQARAVHAVRPLRELTLVDRDLTRAETLAAQLAADLPGTKIGVSSDAEEAVAGRDIICCATTTREPLFRAEALTPQAHVNAIGAFRPDMRELPDHLLATSYLVVDDLSAVLEESGEIIHAIGTGTLRQDDLVPLSDALQRNSFPDTRTVFKSVGLAVQDWAIARLLADQFLRQNAETP